MYKSRSASILILRCGPRLTPRSMEMTAGISPQHMTADWVQWVAPDSPLRFLCGEMPGIYLHEIPPPIGNIIEGENRGDGAHWHTCSAIDALHRIDVELGLRFEIHFVFFRVNAIDRARINARSIFHVDARLGNHVGHEDSPTSSLKGASWQKP